MNTINKDQISTKGSMKVFFILFFIYFGVYVTRVDIAEYIILKSAPF
jgi:hypothetical protein